MTVYGGQINVTGPIRGAWSWNAEGIYALYGNEVPESLKPDYEDVHSYRIHASVEHSKTAIGMGYWSVSDDKGDITGGIFDTFDPLEEDDLMPYNDQNNAYLWYIDGRAKVGPVSMDIAFGYGKNDALKSYSRELDVWIYYAITPELQLGGYVVWTDYDTDNVASYNRTGASLTYSF